jgi:RNA polymerase sigma factor (sigma-70 family)
MAQGLGPVIRYLERATAGQPEELLSRFIDHRDERAFAALVRNYGPLVLGVCRRQLRHEQDAEDVFQATFLVLARRASSVRRRASLDCWLHGVALRLARKARAKLARRPGRLPEMDLAAPPVNEEWLRHDLRRVLDEEIARLPRHYREPVVLCHLQGRTNEEAARALGCPRGTVQSRLVRARAYLARRLQRRGVGPDGALAFPVPASLASATTQTVLGHTASAHVMALATQGGLTMRSKVILFVLLVGSLIGASTGAGEERAAPPSAEPKALLPPPKWEAPAERNVARQPPREKKETRVEAVLRAWAQANEATKTVHYRFVQTERDKAFGTTSEVRGEVRARKPDLLRIDCTEKGKPTETILVTAKSTHLYRFATRTELVHRKKGKGEGEPFWDKLVEDWKEGLFLVYLSPDVRRLTARYNVKFVREDRWYTYLELQPRTNENRAGFTRMRIVLLRANHALRQLWMEHANGNEATVDYLRSSTAPEGLTREAILRGLPTGWKRVNVGEGP